MKTSFLKKKFGIKIFNVIIEKDYPRGYHAWCPDLAGCHSQGDTVEEARVNIAEAIEGYLASLTERRKSVPQFEKSKVFIEHFAIPVPLLDKQQMAVV